MADSRERERAARLARFAPPEEQTAPPQSATVQRSEAVESATNTRIEKIKQVVDTTNCTRGRAAAALEYLSWDVELAVTAILDGSDPQSGNTSAQQPRARNMSTQQPQARNFGAQPQGRSMSESLSEGFNGFLASLMGEAPQQQRRPQPPPQRPARPGQANQMPGTDEIEKKAIACAGGCLLGALGAIALAVCSTLLVS
mmetsp:Transcript_32777/g.71569  ORF Transcript_32777/g.71569 Transcript_32777/m.71569 type:complete len:199 (+) Transcript_32777:69-665(+)